MIFSCGGVERTVVSTLAGGVNGTIGNFFDASGSNAGFRNPSGVAVDVSGNVFVADTDNNRIRKVTPGGSTRTGSITLCALSFRTFTSERLRVIAALSLSMILSAHLNSCVLFRLSSRSFFFRPLVF